MKEKIILLTPVYNDWKSLDKLLSKINNIFDKKLKSKFELIIINDCSKEKYNFRKYKLKAIQKITILSLSSNVGSQRAIAIGIKYLSNFYKKNFKTIIMDSDGQDNPNAIDKIVNLSNSNPGFSVVINRGQRKEPFWFKFFYEMYYYSIRIFCAKKIRFGNFSLINSKHIRKISLESDLWGAFPPTVSKNISDLVYLTVNREKRYGGKSKMNFFGLILHAFKVFSVLKKRILIFSIIYSLFFFFIFFDNQKFYFYTLVSSLGFFNLINFFISFNYAKNFLKNFEKIKVKFI
jgi:hypothetical protein